MYPIFLGRVERGKITFMGGEHRLISDYLIGLEGKEVEVIVRPRHSLRTIQQNRYLWGVVYRIISEDTGMPVEDIHEFCKWKFLGARKIKLGLETYTVPLSTTTLKKDEFFDRYIEPIRAWYASEYGGYIPDPSRVELS